MRALDDLLAELDGNERMSERWTSVGWATSFPRRVRACASSLMRLSDSRRPRVWPRPAAAGSAVRARRCRRSSSTASVLDNSSTAGSRRLKEHSRLSRLGSTVDIVSNEFPTFDVDTSELLYLSSSGCTSSAAVGLGRA